MRLDFHVSTSPLRPSNSTIWRKRPKKTPISPKFCVHRLATKQKPRIGHVFGYMAQNAIPRAPNPPAIPHFLWFPRLRIAQTDA